MSNSTDPTNDPLRPEYDFSEGQRGRYAQQYAAGTNLARIDPDLAAAFPDSEAVNRALRRYQQITHLITTDDSST
jgi:hypothetical protein